MRSSEHRLKERSGFADRLGGAYLALEDSQASFALGRRSELSSPRRSRKLTFLTYVFNIRFLGSEAEAPFGERKRSFCASFGTRVRAVFIGDRKSVV